MLSLTPREKGYSDDSATLKNKTELIIAYIARTQVFVLSDDFIIVDVRYLCVSIFVSVDFPSVWQYVLLLYINTGRALRVNESAAISP